MEKDTLDDLHRAGLFRFHQPKRWGGMELPFVAMFDVPAEIARGCASTGWNVGNLGIHHWMLALYDERAQAEIWGQDPDALIASGIAYPAGAAAGAWTAASSISGFWNFSSGVDPATWNMLAVTVRDGDRVVDHRMCLVPRGEYEIVDDWQVLGMRSTGSKSVRAKDVFVPEHRALCMYLAPRRQRVSRARAATPTRSSACRWPALGSHCLAGAGVGNAQAALELTDRSDQGAQHQLHRRCACATSRPCSCAWPAPGAQVDAARLVIRADCLEAERIAQRGPRADDRGEAALQAQRRVGDGAVHRGGRLAARAGRRQRHLRSLPDPAPLPRPARAVRAHRLQLGRAGRRRGRWSRWAESSPARRCSRSLGGGWAWAASGLIAG